MRVLVTSGGTREAIDDVRVLSNRSTGRLGALLVEALHRRGHGVTLLHGSEACLPDAAVSMKSFESSADLSQLLQQEVPGCDAVFQAAAVADYLPDTQAGKLSSDADTLTLQLRRAPKLVDRLRALAPEALLVGFKLTSGATGDERVQKAQDLLARAQLDAVLANDARALGDREHQALLVTAEGIVASYEGKAAIAEGLADFLEREP